MAKNGSLSYAIIFARSARKELEKLDHGIAIRIVRRTEDLLADPRPAGCKKLSGQNSLWRIRIGDYRVVYSINDATRVINISIIRHRSNIYKDLNYEQSLERCYKNVS